MGILRSDLIAHSQLTSANASVLFNGGDGNAGNTGLKTADVGNKYELMADIGALTIECWINCTSTTTTFDTIWATNNYGVSGQGGILYQHNDGLYLSVSNMSDLSVTGLFETDTWYHVASVREWVADLSLYEWRLYVDGVMVGSATASTSVTEDVICIGSSNYGSGWPHWSFAGYISNFRMCRKALYRQNFTPSKFKLKNVPGTVLLCCQDASSATAVTVGDTLTSGGSPSVSAFGPDLKEDNTDTGVVFEDNTKFDTLSYMVPPGGRTDQRGRGRGVFGGGYTSVPSGASVKRMYYIQIDSMGTSGEFGDMAKVAAYGQGGCSSSTRGLFTGGTNPTNLQDIDYITIATTSNGLDFGDLRIQHGYTSSCSNETRGLTGGGRGVGGNQEIDYVTIATTGNGQDFGDLTGDRLGLGAFENSTRGYFSGGDSNPVTPAVVYKNIDTVLFATTGNATDFGDMTDEHVFHGTASSSTRGIMYGGVTSYGPTVTTNIIEYVTTSSTGSGTDFGDVRDDGEHAHGTSNSIRGVFAGGVNPYRNSIDFITIATTGNGVDWGDLPIASGSYAYAAGLSDSHGGIS